MTLYHSYFITQLIDHRIDQSSSSICMWKCPLNLLYLTLFKTWFFSFCKVYFLHMWPPERKLKTVGMQTYHERRDTCCLMNLFTERLHLVGIWKFYLWTYVLTLKHFFKTLGHLGWILTFIKLRRWSIQSMGDNMLILSMQNSSYMPCHHVLGYSFVITELLWNQWQP